MPQHYTLYGTRIVVIQFDVKRKKEFTEVLYWLLLALTVGVQESIAFWSHKGHSTRLIIGSFHLYFIWMPLASTPQTYCFYIVFDHRHHQFMCGLFTYKCASDLCICHIYWLSFCFFAFFNGKISIYFCFFLSQVVSVSLSPAFHYECEAK